VTSIAMSLQYSFACAEIFVTSAPSSISWPQR
jgi:hypothetical protein